MNPETIGILGYLGLALAVAMLVCGLAYWKLKRRALARLAFLLALGALACAEIHSRNHVSRIGIDPTIQLAKMKEAREQRRQAALDMRGDEVAQIRFAEDDGGEFLDKAGLEESDLKYYESLDEPAWKREKKSRSGQAAGDDDLEALIDTEEAEGGADVDVIEAKQGPEPILMSEDEVVTARRLNRWNLRLAWSLPLLGLALLGHDYLRRFNRYREATLPLPLPSSLPGAITPMPTVIERPEPPRRSIPAELAWLARRGDAFLYLTGDPLAAAKALEHLTAKHRRFEILKVGDRTDDDFIFEALWFGRCSFVIDSPPRAERLMARFIERLEQRRTTRARVRQVAHLVWDLPTAPPEALKPLIESAGMSLFLCRGPKAQK